MIRYRRFALILVTAVFVTTLIVDGTKDRDNPLDPSNTQLGDPFGIDVEMLITNMRE